MNDTRTIAVGDRVLYTPQAWRSYEPPWEQDEFGLVVETEGDHGALVRWPGNRMASEYIQDLRQVTA